MKRKIIQTTISVLIGYACIQAFSSYSAGAPTTMYCAGAGCHSGNSNAFPTAGTGISGIPIYYVPGQTYNMVAGITSVMPNTTVGGIHVIVSGGTILSAGPGAAVSGTTSLYSTTPKPLVNNSAFWTFVWKADSSTIGGQIAVAFGIAGVFANGNGQADSGDYHVNSGGGISFYAQPTGISIPANQVTFRTYPNPALDRLFLSTENDELKSAYAISIDGIRHPLSFKNTAADTYSLDISNLSPGFFQLAIETKTGIGGKTFQKL